MEYTRQLASMPLHGLDPRCSWHVCCDADFCSVVPGIDVMAISQLSYSWACM